MPSSWHRPRSATFSSTRTSRRPYGSERLGELDRLLGQKVLVGEADAIKLYRPDGKIVYATDHSLIGTRELERRVRVGRRRHAEDGGGLARTGTARATPAARTTRRSRRTCRVRFWEGGKPVGVFEVYQSYAPVAAAARSEYRLRRDRARDRHGRTVRLARSRPATGDADGSTGTCGEIHHQALHDSLTGLPEPGAVSRSARADDRSRPPGGWYVGGAVDRPRPLQGDQRHARAPER